VTSMAKESNMLAVLRTRLHGIVVIAGVGNNLRSDDGAGPRLVEMLRERLEGAVEPASFVHLINCRETPENYIGSIAQLGPDTVAVVDIASLGLPPGETRIIEAEELLQHNPSTHRISPAFFMNRLKEETGADVLMVAVQPATTAFGERLSTPVAQALAKLSNILEAITGLR